MYTKPLKLSEQLPGVFAVLVGLENFFFAQFARTF